MAIKTNLPAGILAGDVAPRSFANGAWKKYALEGGDYLRFELWYTERFGWCIPTLRIGGKGPNRRTYAVAISDGQLVTIGHGPHVLARHEVLVKKTRRGALKKFLDLKKDGNIKANDCRDRISTRRANSVIRRYGSSW
jgi:hypothetical protein